MSDLLQSIFEAGSVPTLIARVVDGTILLANPACLRMLGRDGDAIAGRALEDVGLWTPAQRRGLVAQAAREQGCARDVDVEVRTPRGATRPLLATVEMVRRDGEQCLVGTFYEPTERHLQQAWLRESDERFRQVTENIQQCFWLRDVDPPTVLYASPGVEPTFGVSREEFYRNPLALQALIHPDDRDMVLARRDGMTGPDDLEFRIVRPDGETRWIRTRSAPVVTEHGRITRLAAVSEDVTDERELREALRVSEHQFRLLVDGVADYAIVMLDTEGRVTGWNTGAQRIKGYSAGEIIGRHFSVFYPPELLDAGRPQRELDAALATGRYQEEGERMRKDGSRFWADVTLTPIHDEDGELRGFAKVTRDITERQQAEAVVRRAKEEAERANNAKSEFLSRMSHELRTPLHAILGFGELLRRGDLRVEQRDNLEQIAKAGRHLLDLINEVLDLSRIERGELGLSLEPVHAGELVHEMLALAMPLAAARSVTVRAPSAEDLEIHVRADRQRLRQVLLNLLSNAVKYNREGGEVRLACTRLGGSKVRIEVGDTGAGIAASDLARVFDPFERLGAEETDVEGTGLGLALSKRLVEAMGGEIGVDSAVGAGTRLWLELPAAAAPHARRGPATRPAPGARKRGPARTVLYVEDNPSNIKLVETILAERPEVTLIVATQGAGVVELVREHRPALVLLDLNLPDVSGEEVLGRLRRNARTAHVPVVMVSADATPSQIVRMRRAGAEDYLTKPFGLERFLAVIDGAPAGGGVHSVGRHGVADAPVVLDAGAIGALHELARGPNVGASAVRDLVMVFLADSQDRVIALRAAMDREDLAEVAREAHALRGAGGGVGAVEIASLCRRAEDAAMQSDVRRARSALEGLGPALVAARAALEAEFGLTRGDGPGA
jgi:PAS domain S-box-containing protein